MRKAAAALFLVVLILLASCNSTAHDGSEGKSIEITLPENPSTGYSWIWGQMGAGHIELLSDTVIRCHTSDQAFSLPIGTMYMPSSLRYDGPTAVRIIMNDGLGSSLFPSIFRFSVFSVLIP